MSKNVGMQKRRDAVFWAVVLSESSHLFCCVLPTVFSAMSLLAGAGVMVMPAFFVRFHDFLHGWEVPIIVMSGLILALGWALDIHSRKVNCHDTGCCHTSCGPQKTGAHKILIVASFLFAANVAVYLVFHVGMGIVPGHS